MDHFIHWDPNPIFFTVPGVDWPVRYYGVSWGLAFYLANLVMGKFFKAEKRSEEQLGVLTMYVMFAALAGARLGHCLFYDTERYLSHPLEILKIWEGGLASHGAMIGMFLAMWTYCRKYKESLGWLFDRIAIVAPLSAFFIRMGNFFNSEIYGKVTDLPWAIVFTKVDQSPRHPTQLYEAGFYLIVFAWLFHLWKKKRNSLGEWYFFGLCNVLVFGFRFVVEFLKENQSSFENGMPLNMGQLLSIPFVIAGIFLMKKSKMKAE